MTERAGIAYTGAFFQDKKGINFLRVNKLLHESQLTEVGVVSHCRAPVPSGITYIVMGKAIIEAFTPDAQFWLGQNGVSWIMRGDFNFHKSEA